MTSTVDLCRITVIGPDRKADLAVPSRTPVAALLPILLTGTGAAPDTAWVLQRFGQPPFDLAGTPETLDWLDGEEFLLRPAEDPLPELDFDDLADGIAASVNRRTDRWQPHHRRWLFLALTAVALGLLAAVVPSGALPSGAFGVCCLAVAVLTARGPADPVLSGLFAVAAAGFAALSAGPFAAVAVTVVAGVLVVAQRTVAPVLPLVPLLTCAGAAVVVLCVVALRSTMDMNAERAAAVAATAVVLAVVLMPRIAVKVAGLRGPQLPKTGTDMSYDIEPAPSGDVRDRTAMADTYMTTTMLVAALTLPVLFRYVLALHGWPGWTFVTVLASIVLLRARTFGGLWQRLALVAAGVAGFAFVILRFAAREPIVVPILLVALVVPLVFAAVRPWPRRMLPFWEYSATFFDVTTGLLVLPVLAQILGVYAWARGLFG